VEIGESRRRCSGEQTGREISWTQRRRCVRPVVLSVAVREMVESVWTVWHAGLLHGEWFQSSLQVHSTAGGLMTGQERGRVGQKTRTGRGRHGIVEESGLLHPAKTGRMKQLSAHECGQVSAKREALRGCTRGYRTRELRRTTQRAVRPCLQPTAREPLSSAWAGRTAPDPRQICATLPAPEEPGQ